LLGWRGNALKFFRNPIAYMTHLRATYGDVAKLVQGSNPTLFYRSSHVQPSTYFGFGPECNRQILTDIELFQSRPPRGPHTQTAEQMATNLFFINGSRHKQQRKLLMPHFSKNSLKHYHGFVVDYTNAMIDGWKEGEAVELTKALGDTLMYIGSKSFYGIDATKDSESLVQLMRIMMYNMFTPGTMIPINLPGTPYRRMIRLMRRIRDQLIQEIQQKRQGDLAGTDVLSKIVRANVDDPTQVTDDELIGEAFVLFFASQDAGTRALLWTLFLLAQHPDVMAELLDELDEHLHGEAPAYEQIFELPVLDRVVKESLRILSPAIMFGRETSRIAQLGSYLIPAGSEVVYSPYMTHMDPEIYPEPKRFRPDRWLDFKPSAYQYLPFGAGARMCLGASFGAMQVRLMVAIIVQRCRLEVIPGTKIDLTVNVVMSPKNGLPMIVRRQDRDFRKSRGPVEGYITRMVDFS